MRTVPYWALAAVSTLWPVSGFVAATAQQPPKAADAATVADEYTLEIDGTSVDVRAGEAATVRVAGKTVTAKITAKRDKLFRAGDVSFRIPREYSLQTVEQPDGTRLWKLDGDDGVVMLARYAAPIAPEDAVRVMIETFKTQLGEENVKTRPASMKLGVRTHDCTRVTSSVAGQTLLQDLSAWKAGGTAYMLLVQETPQDDGSSTEEVRRVRQLLADTFRVAITPE